MSYPLTGPLSPDQLPQSREDDHSMARTKRTTEETDHLIAELQAKAETAVDDLMKSADWSAWLQWSSHFWQYSFSNQMMIYCQDHHATQVNSFKRWQELGRMVRKGEKSIKIWAPITVRTNLVQETTDDTTGETIETPIKRTAFRLVSVFDITQTDGETEPPGRPAKGELTLDNPAVFEDYVKLWEVLETKGVDIGFEPMAENTGGYYRAPDRIRINDKQSDLASRFRVLLHEAAHYLGDHKSNQDRTDKEVQAELAAYIAAGALGYDLGPASVPYVATWAQDTKVMKTNATATASIAKALIQLVA